MRIMVLADEPDRKLWDDLDRKLLEGIDIILSCGDLPAEYLSFLTCFTSAPIYYVHGNHDESYKLQPPEGCICAEDTICVCKGVRILGLGGSMRYRKGDCQYTEREMTRRVNRLYWKLLHRGGFDILLTHAPARGLGDEEHISHRGFSIFLKLLERYRPAYMVYGHVHREYSTHFVRTQQYLDTTLVNANKRFVIELDESALGKRKRRPG